MPDFRLVADFQPTGDQPAAIERLSEGLARGLRYQTLLGATGTVDDAAEAEGPDPVGERSRALTPSR